MRRSSSFTRVASRRFSPTASPDAGANARRHRAARGNKRGLAWRLVVDTTVASATIRLETRMTAFASRWIPLTLVTLLALGASLGAQATTQPTVVLVSLTIRPDADRAQIAKTM